MKKIMLALALILIFVPIAGCVTVKDGNIAAYLKAADIVRKLV